MTPDTSPEPSVTDWTPTDSSSQGTTPGTVTPNIPSTREVSEVEDGEEEDEVE